MRGRPAMLLLAAACASCAGNGNVRTIGLLPQMRQLQPGDSCTYTYSGTLTPPGGTPAPISGTAINSVISRSGNLLVLENKVTANVFGQTVEMDETATETQRSDGSTAPVSDNGGANQSTRTVVNSTAQSPGFWSAPMSFGGTTTYSNGNQETSSVDVTRTQAVPTSLFDIEAFVANTSLQTNYGYSSTGTSYFSPGLGFFVYRAETVTDALAGVETVTFRLQSTTVPGF